MMLKSPWKKNPTMPPPANTNRNRSHRPLPWRQPEKYSVSCQISRQNYILGQASFVHRSRVASFRPWRFFYRAVSRICQDRPVSNLSTPLRRYKLKCYRRRLKNPYLAYHHFRRRFFSYNNQRAGLFVHDTRVRIRNKQTRGVSSSHPVSIFLCLILLCEPASEPLRSS